MNGQGRRFEYESMGASWAVTIWDEIGDAAFKKLRQAAVEISESFDKTYSRFIPDSLVRKLSEAPGIAEVPEDLTAMLRICERLHAATDGAFNPLVGFALSDMGYDDAYSLAPKENIRPAPAFGDALQIADDTHLWIRMPCLIDIGAIGKGYCVDLIAKHLRSAGMKRFLVDGSGDIFYEGGEPIRAGMEHPDDPSKVIGVVTMNGGGFCASGGNRRAWGKYHHIVDPRSLESPREIIATWVLAPYAALADALATCLFFCAPESLSGEQPFEFCILNKDYKIKRSGGFPAELF